MTTASTHGAEHSTLAERLEDRLAEIGPPLFPDVHPKTKKTDATSPPNIRAFLEWAGLTVRRDTFTKQTLIDGIPGHTRWDDDAIFIVRNAAFEVGLKPTPDLLHDTVRALAGRNRSHPVRAYLDTCGATWDGKPRISTWLQTYAGCEPPSGEGGAEYLSAVGELFLVAAVRRIREPGVKYDTLLVLEGSQGAGKSSICRTLVPNPDWFSDCLPLGAEPKVVIEMTTGRWLCEFAELTGISKRQVEEVKAFLSRQHDAARAAYGREPNERPRQFVAIGTTNDSKYLVDGTGNRRFLPVRVTGKIDLEALRRDRDQLWGEATWRERDFGPDLFPPAHLWSVAAREQEDRRLHTPIEEALIDALGCIEVGYILTADLRTLAGQRQGQGEIRHVKEIADTMRRLGWQDGKHKDQRVWHVGENWRDHPLRVETDGFGGQGPRVMEGAHRNRHEMDDDDNAPF